MKRTFREKFSFILSYNENFDKGYLLEDLMELITEEQLKSIFDSYKNDYIEAWEAYNDNKDYYGDKEEPDDNQF